MYAKIGTMGQPGPLPPCLPYPPRLTCIRYSALLFGSPAARLSSLTPHSSSSASRPRTAGRPATCSRACSPREDHCLNSLELQLSNMSSARCAAVRHGRAWIAQPSHAPAFGAHAAAVAPPWALLDGHAGRPKPDAPALRTRPRPPPHPAPLLTCERTGEPAQAVRLLSSHAPRPGQAGLGSASSASAASTDPGATATSCCSGALLHVMLMRT